MAATPAETISAQPHAGSRSVAHAEDGGEDEAGDVEEVAAEGHATFWLVKRTCNYSRASTASFGNTPLMS